ncbi:hypothetical protein [Elizabethkingia miricola]|uniref:hypothetical protein n=1 Tax=Elizabethkingia miricola TaxID=172045 RepID=UPI0038927914
MSKAFLKNIYFIDVFDSEVDKSISTHTLYMETVSNFNFVDANVNHKIFQLSSKEELFNKIEQIKNEIQKSDYTLLYLSIHGSCDLDGIISTNKELISWEELKDKTREINIKTNDRFFIILASCHGKYIGEKINLKNKSPFRAIIASKYEVYSKDIYNIFHDFFQSLLYDNNIIEAFKKIQDNQKLFFYTDTHKALEYGFKKFIENKDKKYPKLYQEYLSENRKPHYSYNEYRNLLDSKIPEILENIEKDFFI